MRSKVDHVLSKTGFADEEGSLVILFDSVLEFINLGGHFGGGSFVFGNG